MSYRVCPGVVLATVCGENLLIATREARGRVSNIKQLNGTGAYFWRHFEQGREVDTIVAQTAEDYHIPPEQVGPALETFMKALTQAGYLLQEGDPS